MPTKTFRAQYAATMTGTKFPIPDGYDARVVLGRLVDASGHPNERGAYIDPDVAWADRVRVRLGTGENREFTLTPSPRGTLVLGGDIGHFELWADPLTPVVVEWWPRGQGRHSDLAPTRRHVCSSCNQQIPAR